MRRPSWITADDFAIWPTQPRPGSARTRAGWAVLPAAPAGYFLGGRVPLARVELFLPAAGLCANLEGLRGSR
jgi:hypothetical protein